MNQTTRIDCITNGGFHVINEAETCENCGVLIIELLRVRLGEPPSHYPGPPLCGGAPTSARTDSESYLVRGGVR